MAAARAVSPAGAMGIEIGSLYLKSVEVDEGGAIVWKCKEKHRGNSEEFIESCRSRAASRGVPLGVVTRGAVPGGVAACDPVVALAEGVRSRCPEARNILEVGGSSLTLVHLDQGGRILSVHRNSLCAAGTGSFLDEQAARLCIDRNEPREPLAEPPGIATRCAVFAKSDLIHRQQEGWSPEAVWSGLCRGLADGVLRTLTYGRPLEGVTALCGGVSLDPSFVFWFERCLRNRNGHRPAVSVVPEPEFAAALGAALLASTARRTGVTAVYAGAGVATERGARRPPLALVRSHYPESTAVARFIDEQANEVTLHRSGGGAVEVMAGFDIGSTSTKCALVDPEGRLVLDVYRQTQGDPVGAIRKLLGAVTAAASTYNLDLLVRGAATTGSGRKLVGKVIGADLVVNEISAHAAGAIHVEPAVETIFEIGGQDAKYIGIRQGRVVDANMNYVCAAGTGSFVEELASKLGYAIGEVGESVTGVAPPYTSSRCTVFMEQDVFSMLRRGSSRQEALGAVLYSVVENYLERVVGRRPISRERVFFQGATARNRGLVAAVENLLGVEVIVSPSCHVMGAYGAALLAGRALRGGATRFRGLDLGSRSIRLTHETCELCVNRCRLTRVEIEGESDRPAWGMACGRDEQDTKVRVPREYSLMRRRIRLATKPAKTPPPAAASGEGSTAVTAAGAVPVRIGLPLALATFGFMEFWSTFFRSIGMEVVPSGPTDQACMERSREHAAPELCLPLKVLHGHMAALAGDDGVDAVFLPHFVSDHPTPGTTGSKFCPYVETAPSVVGRALGNGHFSSKPLLAPVIDFTLSADWNAKQLRDALKPIAPIDLRRVRRAFVAAMEARRRERDKLAAWGDGEVARAASSGKPAVVIVGRPYNTLDPGISLDVPYHVADCGFDVVPMDCLRFDAADLTGEMQGMFWHYGQRILSATAKVARTEGLYAVYLTSFGCGPDSFLLTYAEALMGGKPFLVLELDEHGSNGGYQTRIEAFLDVITSDFEARRMASLTPDGDGGSGRDSRPEGASAGGAALSAAFVSGPGRELAGKTLWIPPMYEPGHRLFAAAFRSRGIDAAALPSEDDESYAIGRRVTRGTECLPCPLTLGVFIKHMESEKRAGRNPEATAALFMPTTCGPCRFGQYRTLARLVFDGTWLADVPVVSPTQEFRNWDSDTTLRDRVWHTILASDILFKLRCRVRPRERTAGDAEGALERWAARLEREIETGSVDWKHVIRSASDDFARIPVRGDEAPLVGVVGEIYLRSNPYANGRLIDTIERMGGEVWLAPVGEWVEYVTWAERFRLRQEGAGLIERLKVAATWHYMLAKAHRMYAAAPLLSNRLEPPLDRVMDRARRFLPPEFQGEAILTLGRAVLFAEQGADLIVNCAPFGCMQGNITTAIFERLGDELPLPIVNLFYDGSDDNLSLATFLQQAAERRASGPR